jgi:hypothetical protein
VLVLVFVLVVVEVVGVLPVMVVVVADSVPTSGDRDALDLALPFVVLLCELAREEEEGALWPEE